jgi:hypothetical protein
VSALAIQPFQRLWRTYDVLVNATLVSRSPYFLAPWDGSRGSGT